MLVIVITFLFVDLFDTVGCLVGVASKGDLLDENGKLPKAKQALFADAIATTAGALLGTSTVTSYVESASGIGEGGRTGLTAMTTGILFLLSLFLSPLFIAALLGTSTVTSYVESASGIGEGGRTGLTAMTTGILFLLSLFLSPLFIAVPTQATSPVLIIVGVMMARVGVMMASSLKEIDFNDFTNAIPAFLTLVMMPFAYSIADGIIFGIISFTILKLATGKSKEVNIYLIVLSILFALKFVFIKIIFGIISFTILKLATGKSKEVNIYLIVLSILFALKFVFINH